MTVRGFQQSWDYEHVTDGVAADSGSDTIYSNGELVTTWTDAEGSSSSFEPVTA